MAALRIGAPGYVSARPLLYGLTARARAEVVLTYAEPGDLADAIDREQLDAALIPSIEFLRGTGRHVIEGPGLAVGGRTGGIVLVTDRPMTALQRVAVTEKCRTPLAALRLILDGLHGVMPDFCVYKSRPEKWHEYYDGILLDGDNGIGYCSSHLRESDACYDVGEMWESLYKNPLVLSVWVYNDESLTKPLTELLVESRDFGVSNLSELADGVARTSHYSSEFLCDYFTTGWRYNLGPAEEQGLRILEENAIRYQLLRKRRDAAILQR